MEDQGTEVFENLKHLREHGYVLIRGALDPTETADFANSLRSLYGSNHPRGQNDVGTVWFDDVLDVEPRRYSTLIGHPAVSAELREIGGRQVQLRSMRGHYYPGAYEQHWHMDFYGYWDQAHEGTQAATGLAINTTFYLQDGGPATSHLEVVARGHLQRPPGVARNKIAATESNEFTRWCQDQDTVNIYPQAGDCLVFYSHLPHRGIKSDPSSERSNVVCHYQLNPFFPQLWFLSDTLGDSGIYPFA